MLKKTPVNYIPVGGLGNTIKGVLTGCTKILEKLSDDYSMKARMDERGCNHRMSLRSIIRDTAE